MELTFPLLLHLLDKKQIKKLRLNEKVKRR